MIGTLRTVGMLIGIIFAVFGTPSFVKPTRRNLLSFITGISFGLTSAVITSLGLIVGLNSATSSKLAVVAGIVVIAVADGLSDAAGMHLSEEAEMEAGHARHSATETWITTAITFYKMYLF